MKILVVCHRFPFPAEGGGKIRALKIIEHLGKKHEVHVFSMIRSEEEYKGISDCKKICSSITAPFVKPLQVLISLLGAVLKSKSLSEGYFSPPKVRRAMNDLVNLKRFDLAVIHSSSVGPLVSELKVPRIFDFCDMDSRKWELFGVQGAWFQRLIYRREAKKVMELEQRLSLTADAVSVATPAEQKALLEIAPTTRMPFWFSNGVDVEYFKPIPASIIRTQLCFVGRMDYLPNVDCVEWFVSSCWVKIRDQQPDAKFVIIGANPVSRVKLLERYEGVSVTGTVSDVRPFLGCSVAMVAPLRIARGIQNKILESMAMGVPVVTSGMCIEALSPAVARIAIRADSETEVIKASLNIIRDHAERRRRSVLSRRAVRIEATWAANLRFLDKVIEDLTEGAETKVY